jgi:hypothetical protein
MTWPAGDVAGTLHQRARKRGPMTARARSGKKVSRLGPRPILKKLRSSMTANTYARQENVPVVQFRKGQRKDDVVAEHLKEFTAEEGVLFIGKAQENTPVFPLRAAEEREDRRHVLYPWLVPSTAMVNHFYVHRVDRDFGPFFLKVQNLLPVQRQASCGLQEHADKALSQGRAEDRDDDQQYARLRHRQAAYDK